jgi:hypothetical protein
MAKVTKETEKWGQLTAETHGLSFIGEELVPLMIPIDKQNPVKERFLCINGNQIWLAVGKMLKVPQSVAENWNLSYMGTIEAEAKMSQEIEIKA